jgi:hypothetical protein
MNISAGSEVFPCGDLYREDNTLFQRLHIHEGLRGNKAGVGEYPMRSGPVKLHQYRAKP